MPEHPCTTDPSIPECIELAEKAAAEAAPTMATVQETLAANGPMIAEHVNNALAHVGEWVEATEDFAAEQAPLLVHEIVYFEIASNAFWVLLGMLMIGWGIFAYRWSHRRAKERMGLIDEHSELLKTEMRKSGGYTSDTQDVVFSFAHYGVPISGAATTVLGLIFILVNIMDVVKPIVAPRLFLIEYFRQLI